MWPFKKNRPTTQVSKNERVYNLKDYDDTYIHIKKLLLLLGIRLTRQDSRYVKLLWNIFYWFEFINYVEATILDLVLMQELVKNGDFNNMTTIFRTLPCIGYLVLALLKTYKMVCKRPVYENLIAELRSMWPQGLMSGEEHAVISKALKEIHFFVKILYYSNYGLLFSITIPPCIDVVKRAFGHDIPRTLPFNNWMPYNSSQPGWFEFTLALQYWHTFTTVWGVLAGYLMFCVLLCHITIQFDLLCIKIQRLFYVPIDEQLIASYPLGEYDDKMTESEKNDYQNLGAVERNTKHFNELADILKRHNALIRLANDVEDLFSFSQLYNFMCSSLIICLCSFCCLLVEKWNQFIYKFFLISVLLQTWLLCWCGQKLFESSQKVSDALYNSGWYTAPINIRKSILIMMRRSQKSVHTTTYGFSIICLSSFTSIIKTSWSYLTLILNFYKE